MQTGSNGQSLEGHVHHGRRKLPLDLEEENDNDPQAVPVKLGIFLALLSSSAHATACLTSFSILARSPASSAVESLLAFVGSLLTILAKCIFIRVNYYATLSLDFN